MCRREFVVSLNSLVPFQHAEFVALGRQRIRWSSARSAAKGPEFQRIRLWFSAPAPWCEEDRLRPLPIHMHHFGGRETVEVGGRGVAVGADVLAVHQVP